MYGNDTSLPLTHGVGNALCAFSASWYEYRRSILQFQGLDELLVYGNDTSLPLTHGVGSALCASTNTDYEYRRSINGRIQLVGEHNQHFEVFGSKKKRIIVFQMQNEIETKMKVKVKIYLKSEIITD